METTHTVSAAAKFDLFIADQFLCADDSPTCSKYILPGFLVAVMVFFIMLAITTFFHFEF